MRDLLDRNVHSIILTSGTLSPLAATITEIGIPINVQLQNSHVIKDNQASDIIKFNHKLFYFLLLQLVFYILFVILGLCISYKNWTE